MRGRVTSTASIVAALTATSAHTAWSGPASETACAERATAIGQIACELARQLPRAELATLVVAAPVVTEVRGERLEQLAAALTRLTAGELGDKARANDLAVPRSELHRLARPALRLVLLSAKLDRDRLSVNADVIGSVPRFWERVQGISPGSTGHAFASRNLDAELHAYLPPIPLVVTRIDKAAPLEEPALAVACGDVDGDGSIEVVTVGRRRVQIGRLENGRFVVERGKAWTELADVAPAPLREPIATAYVSAQRAIDVGISDRAHSVRLDADLSVLGRFAGRLPWPAGGCARIGAVGLDAARAPCTGATRIAAGAESIDAVAGLRWTRTDGGRAELFARRRQKDSRLEVELGSRTEELRDPVGAQVAIGDLDGNGEPELVTTENTLDAALDAVRVRTLTRSGTFEDAFRIPVPSGVRSLAVCPAGGPGMSPLVVSTGDGIWVVR